MDFHTACPLNTTKPTIFAPGDVNLMFTKLINQQEQRHHHRHQPTNNSSSYSVVIHSMPNATKATIASTRQSSSLP
jgi:hypothetical protein